MKTEFACVIPKITETIFLTDSRLTFTVASVIVVGEGVAALRPYKCSMLNCEPNLKSDFDA